MAAEITLAVVLVIGAGLLVKTFWRLRQVDPGFRAENVLAADIQLPASRYDEWHRILGSQEELLDELHQTPGCSPPHWPTIILSRRSWIDSFRIEGRVDSEVDEAHSGRFRPVSTDYFRTVGIELKRGRSFTERDDASRPSAVVINGKRRIPAGNFAVHQDHPHGSGLLAIGRDRDGTSAAPAAGRGHRHLGACARARPLRPGA